jgi:hypothetical protein
LSSFEVSLLIQWFDETFDSPASRPGLERVVLLASECATPLGFVKKKVHVRGASQSPG